METARVKIYHLTSAEEEAIRTVRGIIEELYDDDFFEYEPLEEYSSDIAISLMNELLDTNGQHVGE